MDTPAKFYLTLLEKVRLASTVFVIYWPIRLYITFSAFNAEVMRHHWFIWLIEIPLTILFFTFWLSVTAWLEERFYQGAARRSPIDAAVPAQLATFLIAGALAVLFNGGFHSINVQLMERFDPTPREATLPGAIASTNPPPQKAGVGYFPEAQEGRRRARHGLTIMAMLMAYYLAANKRSYKQLMKLNVSTEQLKREASQAQFTALKNQVNPHFLFNSLSILSSLVLVRPQLSVQFIDQLARAYRYILDQQDAQQVRLKTELDFLKAYLFLLRIRFEEKLQVINQLTEADAGRYQIAPLTLQLLIENAVKHNLMSLEQPLIVSIRIEGDFLVVSNPIQLRPAGLATSQIGLQNITNRYSLLTPRPVLISRADATFTVKIPLLP